MSAQRDRRGGSAHSGHSGHSGRGGSQGAPRASSQTVPPYRPLTPEQRDRLHAVIEPIVVGAGYDLEDLSVSRVGRRSLVRIAVDSDRGVNLDAIAELSRDISAKLDAAESAGTELINGEYELEVGSRGVERPLTEPRHWRRNTSRLVQVRISAGPDAPRTVTGRVTAVDDAGVTLDVDGVPERVGWADLGPGKVQVELKRLADLPDVAGDGVADDDLADDDADDDDDLADDGLVDESAEDDDDFDDDDLDGEDEE